MSDDTKILSSKEDKETQDKKLARLKKTSEYARQYFQANIDRYHKSRRFVFKSGLDDTDRTILSSTKKPTIEFNITEAFVSRLRGEFSKQEPSLCVSASDGEHIDLKTLEVIEGYLRHILFEANQNGCEYNTYTDSLTGGFSVWKVWTEYAANSGPTAFDQIIRFDRVYDPTLCGFDPMARLPTKADGRYSFELYPKTKDELKILYPDADLKDIQFTSSLGGFNWSYKSGEEDMVLLEDHYEKVEKPVDIVYLSNRKVITKKKYKEYLAKWKEAKHIEEPAQIVKERKATQTVIMRTVFIENQILQEEETDFEDLPHVFVDGNSILLRDTDNGPVQQMTRSYTYNMEGAQRLKNYAGQCLGAELQNMVSHKWKIPKEGIPQQYAKAYIDNQIPNIVVYNAFKDNNPDVPLPPPMEVQRPPIPPEIMQTFVAMDNLSQTILGSFDAALGINDNQLSGVAIVEGATQSNSASMPYVVGYMQALTQVAKILLNLIPKYHVTPRSIPVVDADTRRRTVRVNDELDPQSIYFNYDSNSLSVKVEAGVNFAIQKSKSLNQMISASQAFPTFGQFMAEKGLRVFVRNFDIKDGDQLYDMADQYMKELDEMKKEAKQQQQQQEQNNPTMMELQLKQQELQLRAQKMQMESQTDGAKVGVAQQAQDNDRLRIMMEAKQNHDTNLLGLAKQQSERERASVDLALGVAGHHHKVNKDMTELHHKIVHANTKAPAA